MPVLLAPGDFEAWLQATGEQAHALVHKASAVPLAGEPAPWELPARTAHRVAPASNPEGTRSLF